MVLSPITINDMFFAKSLITIILIFLIDFVDANHTRHKMFGLSRILTAVFPRKARQLRERAE